MGNRVLEPSQRCGRTWFRKAWGRFTCRLIIIHCKKSSLHWVLCLFFRNGRAIQCICSAQPAESLFASLRKPSSMSNTIQRPPFIFCLLCCRSCARINAVLTSPFWKVLIS